MGGSARNVDCGVDLLGLFLLENLGNPLLCLTSHLHIYDSLLRLLVDYPAHILTDKLLLSFHNNHWSFHLDRYISDFCNDWFIRPLLHILHNYALSQIRLVPYAIRFFNLQNLSRGAQLLDSV